MVAPADIMATAIQDISQIGVTNQLEEHIQGWAKDLQPTTSNQPTRISAPCLQTEMTLAEVATTTRSLDAREWSHSHVGKVSPLAEDPTW
jgi:hypothetical protein